MQRTSRKAQSYVEYVFIVFVSLSMGLIAFYPTVGNTSEYIADSAPKLNEKQKFKDTTGIFGVDAGLFVNKFDELAKYSDAKNCAKEVLSSVDKLADIKNDTMTSLTEKDLVKLVNTIADNKGSSVSATNLVNKPLCQTLSPQAQVAADDILEIIKDQKVNLSTWADICIEHCKVTTTSNVIMRDIETLITIGLASKNDLKAYPGSPVTASDLSNLTLNEILMKYYYIDSNASTAKKTNNYKNSINLMEYMASKSATPQAIKDNYLELLASSTKALDMVVSKPSTPGRPSWEKVPVQPVTSSSSSSGSSSSSSPKVYVPKIEFCSD